MSAYTFGVCLTDRDWNILLLMKFTFGSERAWPLPIPKVRFGALRIILFPNLKDFPSFSPVPTPLRFSSSCQVDSTVRKHRAPDPTKERFSFKAFEFSDQSKSFVYLHCHMTVCNISNPDSRCSIGCLQFPRKRRAAEEPGAQLRQGPLFFVGSETNSAKRAAQGEKDIFDIRPVFTSFSS